MTPDDYTISEQMLEVSDGHTLYVHDWGNEAAATPIIFLHGGPGGECGNRSKLYFDPAKQRVIFFDQRGCGKSTPNGLLRNNTTQSLSDDITVIARRFEQKKYILVGGSWGSCLALYHALQQPEPVGGMVLAGIFTGSRSETDWFDRGHFKTFFPDVWEEYLEKTPAGQRDDPTAYHVGKVFGLDDYQASLDSASIYDTAVGKIYALDDRFAPDDPNGINIDSKKIELNFLRQRYFMDDNYILDNAAQLTMPAWIVQGRYDMLCPPITAYKLAGAMPNARLVWTQTNHRTEHEDTTVIKLAVAQLCEAAQ